MRYNPIELTQTITNGVTSAGQAVIDAGGLGADSLSVECIVTDTTPEAVAIPSGNVVVSGDSFSVTAHGLITGLVGQFTTSGTLPSGLATSTDYYVIASSADSFKVASGYAAAIAGTAVTIYDQGDNTDTFTPTALNSNLKLQQSNDNSNWIDIGSGTNVTGDSQFLLTGDADCRYMRVYLTLTGGAITASNYVLGKGDR